MPKRKEVDILLMDYQYVIKAAANLGLSALSLETELRIDVHFNFQDDVYSNQESRSWIEYFKALAGPNGEVLFKINKYQQEAEDEAIETGPSEQKGPDTATEKSKKWYEQEFSYSGGCKKRR